VAFENSRCVRASLVAFVAFVSRESIQRSGRDSLNHHQLTEQFRVNRDSIPLPVLATVFGGVNFVPAAASLSKLPRQNLDA
jgi:hypothetical protein